MQIAPWLRPTDVLGALQAGSHVGLSARQADQRDAEMAQRAELEAQQEQRIAQEAAARLREHYDALAQARELALRDYDYRSTHDTAKLLQDKTESDALALYRSGVLKNQAERNRQSGVAKPFLPKVHNFSGTPFLETSPGVLEVANVPGFTGKSEIPKITNIPLDANPKFGTTSPKISLLADDPLANKLAGTNAWNSLVGTNWPTKKALPAPVTPAPNDKGTNDKGSPKDQMPPVVEPALEKKLDVATAKKFVELAKGDKQKARQLAKDAGYSF